MAVDEKGQRRIPTRALVSYTIDIVLKTALFVACVVVDKVVTPFAQHFSLDDISLQYPYKDHQRIPTYLLIIISGICPAIIIAIYALIIDGLFSHRCPAPGHTQPVHTLPQRLWELHSGILGLLTAQGLAFVITSILKNLCGRPRPDLIARCLPRKGSVDGSPFGLVSKAICTQQDEGVLKDGFRSFPSGHACSAFSGLFYLSLYLAAKLRIADQRGDFWRSFVVLFPLLASACVATTRIMDAEHHGFDVLFGSALGILCAWIAYRQYFPPISHTWKKGHAYPMKTWGKPAERILPAQAAVVDPEMVDSENLKVLHGGPPLRPETPTRNLRNYIVDFNSSHNGPPTLPLQIPGIGQQQTIFPVNHTSGSSTTVAAVPEARSSRTSLSSDATVTIKTAEYAYSIRNPGPTAQMQHPPQAYTPVQASALPRTDPYTGNLSWPYAAWGDMHE